jgi:hypothetical protein
MMGLWFMILCGLFSVPIVLPRKTRSKLERALIECLNMQNEVKKFGCFAAEEFASPKLSMPQLSI